MKNLTDEISFQKCHQLLKRVPRPITIAFCTMLASIPLAFVKSKNTIGSTFQATLALSLFYLKLAYFLGTNFH